MNTQNIDTSSLELLASICMNELENIKYPTHKRNINDDISISHLNEINNRIAQINNPNISNKDKFNIVISNMNLVERVLMRAFVCPTKTVNKNIAPSEFRPTITYTDNQLVNTILDKTFVLPLEYHNYK
jgi:hypothetical protein